MGDFFLYSWSYIFVLFLNFISSVYFQQVECVQKSLKDQDLYDKNVTVT